MSRRPFMYLLKEYDLEQVRGLLLSLRGAETRVLDTWHQAYVEHFGDDRSMSEPVFRDIYARDLAAVINNLAEMDLEGFSADVRAVGRALCEHAVPFAEVVISMHLFEESAGKHFQLATSSTGSQYLAFDKLSHCRMVLLAEAYFTEHHAGVTARMRGLEREADTLAGGPTGRASFHGLIGKSAAMRRVYTQIAAAARGQAPVLVVGESGTGKELAARALHECMGPVSRPFLAVNCSALPRELIESELFGYQRGAYTGAQGEYSGLVRAATGGTLFLDEVTEMAPESQAKLLRTIEDRVVRAVGSTREVAVDVRFVASTNRDPEKAVEAGLLRRDLYYRLNTHTIVLPPLRERGDDVPPLLDHFLALFADRGLRRIERVDASALAAFCGYPWPGNVRELRNVVEQSLTVAEGPGLSLADLPSHLVSANGAQAAGNGARVQALPTLDEAERDLIARALEVTAGNKMEAARLLRISRHRLYDKLRKYGLPL